MSRNPLARRAKPAPVEIDDTPLHMSLAELGALELRQVRRTPDEALFNGLMEQHHYLGYTQPVGEHLKYIGTGRRAPEIHWILLGLTTGRGKDATSRQANRPAKQILGYPLVKDFRQRLALIAAQ